MNKFERFCNSPLFPLLLTIVAMTIESFAIWAVAS